MNSIEENNGNSYLTEAAVLKFLNIASAFFLFLFSVLMFLIRLLEAPALTPFLLAKVGFMFLCAVIIVITALLLRKKQSTVTSAIQVVLALFFLGTAKCVVKEGIAGDPVLLLPVLIVSCAFAVILTNIAYSRIKNSMHA